MKSTKYLLVFFLSCVTGFSQEDIELKAIPFIIQNQDIYIEKVFDDRPEQSLGVVKNISGKKANLKLKDGASTAIKKFMDVSLTIADNRTPIYIRIKALEIQQVQTSIDKMTARVHIRLSFFSKIGSTEGELFSINHYEDEILPLSNLTEIYESHEKRIRAALEYCILSFINKPDLDTPVLETKSSLGKWFNLLTFKKIFNKHSEGWEVGYTGFANSEKDFIIPFEMSYGQLKAKSNLARDNGYSSVDSYVLGGGFNGYVKITSGVYVNLGVNVPIGVEVLRDLENKKSHNFLVGVGANQGLKIIPWKDFGIVIGAGLFQQVQTSKIMKRNFGFELELGINF